MTLGLKDLYYAVCTEADGAESYGTPKKMAEAMSADLSVKTADGSAFAVGKDYYVYICDSRIDSADEKYVISLNSTYPTGWNATNSRKIGGFHYGRCRKVDSNLQPLNGSRCSV